jgi:RNA polymerase sigma-B factor
VPHPRRKSAGRPELRGETDYNLLRAIQAYPIVSNAREAACDELVRRYEPLVHSCVMRYQGSPEPAEVLLQVGYVGFLKAINNFDPDIGTSQRAYAAPCITGEIKRHFRDKRWQVHVRRAAQETRLEIREATGPLAHRLSRMPTDAELAEHLALSADAVADARQADQAFVATSITAPLSGDAEAGTLGDLLGYKDPQLETSRSMDAVWAHLDELPPREQRILTMRFYGNMTQADIGRQSGISQMHVPGSSAMPLPICATACLNPARIQTWKNPPNQREEQWRTTGS